MDEMGKALERKEFCFYMMAGYTALFMKVIQILKQQQSVHIHNVHINYSR